MGALDAMLGHLDPSTIQRMAGQLGATPQQTQTAIQAALPLLMGAMQRNAGSRTGADQLYRAVADDHQGVDLDELLGGLLGRVGDGAYERAGPGGARGLGGNGLSSLSAQRPPLETGRKILGHIFGGQQPRAEAGVARASGLNMGSAGQLLAMLAPLLMGALGRATQQRNLDSDGLNQTLDQDTGRMSNGAGGGLQQVLKRVLDGDGDGDVDARDLLQHGATLISMFGAMRR